MTRNTPHQTGAPLQAGWELPRSDGGGPSVQHHIHGLDEAFNQGVALCQQGHLAEAERRFRAILAVQPSHSDSLHVLAVLCSQQGKYPEALGYIDAALRINGESADGYNIRGSILAALKRLDAALASFERAAALQPDSPIFLSNLGNALQELGRFNEAIAAYDKVIGLDPDDAETFYNRGSLLQTLKRFEEAIESYDKAIALRADYAQAATNRGVVLKELKRPDEAIASFDKAIAIDPSLPEAWGNRGATLQDLERFEEALASYDRAIALKPDFAEAFNNRGVVLQALGRFYEALASHDKAIELQADYAEAYSNRGNAFRKLDNFDQALLSYDKAITLDPHYAECFYNRGVTLQDVKRLDEALAAYDQAIALSPGYAEAHWNRACVRLLAGRYKDGWQDYQWRWRNEFSGKPLNVRAAFWQGEDPAGRHLLIFAEQGIGDIIQFARYLPLLTKTGARVTLAGPAKLMRLLRPLTRRMRVVSEIGELEHFDFQCALLDLPLRFGTELPSIPAEIPYLSAEDDLVARWNERIGHEGLKVGIAWQGNPDFKADRGRSIPLEEFLPLAMEGIRLISLQKHHGLDQLAGVSQQIKIETPGHDYYEDKPDEFLDTAAVMQNLDLIVTSDTSIAHLAGALGRPTWVALRYVPDWRWLLDRTDSPWYPTARLFRQAERDSWTSVFSQIQQGLRELLHR